MTMHLKLFSCDRFLLRVLCLCHQLVLNAKCHLMENLRI